MKAVHARETVLIEIAVLQLVEEHEAPQVVNIEAGLLPFSGVRQIDERLSQLIGELGVVVQRILVVARPCGNVAGELGMRGEHAREDEERDCSRKGVQAPSPVLLPGFMSNLTVLSHTRPSRFTYST